MGKRNSCLVGIFSYIIVCLLLMDTAQAQDMLENNSKYFTQSSVLTEMNSETSLKKRISAKYSEESLKSALEDIAKKAGLQLSYSNKLVPLKKQVTTNFNNVTVNNALWKVLEGTGLRFALSPNDYLVLTKRQKHKRSKQAQEQVSGTVSDAQSGEPLPGVNILVKGTTTGSSTDANGSFELTVPSLQDTLVVSFVGYEKQIVPIDGRTTVDVALNPQAISSEEVVVTGYSQKEKGELTGSVSQIQGEEVAKAPTANIERGLQGKVAGLKINDRGGQPGSSNMNILVRGKATLGNNSPLIVIDGVPSGKSDLENLSSQDIASVNVLKDASAAIYGARAANGVIVVKTKRGQEGTSEISINASSGISTFTRTPELMNSYQMAKYKNEMQERYGRQTSWTKKDLELFKSGSEPITHPDTDWYAATFDDYAPQNHINVKGSGGTEKVQYFVSGDYNHRGSIYRGDDMYSNRYQIRSNIDAQVMEYLDIGFDLSGRLREIHQPAMNPGGIIHRTQLALPMAVAEYPNGKPGYGAVGLNPMIGVTDKAGWNDRTPKTLKSKLSFDLDMPWITKGLSLSGIASFNYDVDNAKTFKNTWDLYQYDIESDTYEELTGKLSENQSFTDLNQSNSVNRQIYYNISLRYKRSFGSHNFNVFAAYEQDEGHYYDLNGYRRNLVSPQKTYLFAASTKEQSTGGVANDSGRLSYFGSISYNYKRKYLIDFTLRRDGSYNFPEEGRFGTFPSVSLGWNISDEPFMDSSSNWLSNLKIRSSYGIMGNDRVPSFQYLTKYALSSSNGYYIFGESPSRHNGFSQSNTPNPNITWEKAKNFNIGFDAELFENRLALNFDYFYDRRRDILISRNASVPNYTGLSLPEENLGKVDNSGVELSANYQNNTGTLGYNVGGNLSYNKNEIVYMDEAKDIPKYREKEGHPLDSWLVYKTDGIFYNQQEIDNTEATLEGTKPGDIKYVDVNGDGDITGEDRYRKYTSATPQIQFGVNVGLNYKGFGLDAFFQGQAKAENYISHNRGAQSNLPEYLYNKRWTKDNKDATYPRAYDRTDFYNYTHRSDFWLYNASFVRLKNLTLSYNLPRKLTSNINFKNIRIYLKGYNLWTLDAMSSRMGGEYYDPEMNSEEGKYYGQRTTIIGGLSIAL